MLRRVARRLRLTMRVKPSEPFVTEIEKADYDKLVKANRKAIAQFWFDQSGQVEANFIAEFEAKEKLKKHNDDKKLRSDIARKCWADARKLVRDSEDEKKRKRYIQRQVFESMSRQGARQRILDVLDKECKTWISHPDVKLTAPTNDVFSSQSDYFIKLQERAMLAAEGHFDEMDEYSHYHEVLDWKNTHLIPKYSKIKSVIRVLLDSPIEKLKNEWLAAKDLAQRKSPGDVEAVDRTYSQLLAILKKRLATPAQRFELLEKQLKAALVLLDLWRQYTFILLMSHEEAKAYMNFERVKSKQEEKLDVQKTYKRILSDFFHGQGEEQTDMEEFASSYQDLESFINRGSEKEDKINEFEQILSEYISEEDIKEFEERFDVLRTKYDSIYGAKKVDQHEASTSFLTKTTIDKLFQADPNIPEKVEADLDLSKLTERERLSTNSSLFLNLMRDRVAQLTSEGLEPLKVESLKELVDRIGEIPVEEPGLLQKMIEYETNLLA